MWLLLVQIIVVVPGKFYIAFLKKREVKKIVIKRPVIFISIEGKKRNPTGLN
jgi:hypothetical protein